MSGQSSPRDRNSGKLSLPSNFLPDAASSHPNARKSEMLVFPALTSWQSTDFRYIRYN
jgi:hypothetical protein